MDSLKKIVNEIFFVDIDKNTRKREIVDARRVYSKILRDFGFSYQHIGDSIGKDHATIIHYIKSIDSLLTYDPSFEKKFIIIKKQFVLENKQLILRSNVDIYTTAENLRNKLDEVILEKKQILIKFVDYLEQFEKTTGYLPNVYDIKHNILPLFEK